MIKREDLLKRFDADFPLQVNRLEEVFDHSLVDKIESGKYDILLDYQVKNITKNTIGIPFFRISFIIPSNLQYVKDTNEAVELFEVADKHFKSIIPKYEEDGYIITYHKYSGNYTITFIFSKEKY